MPEASFLPSTRDNRKLYSCQYKLTVVGRNPGGYMAPALAESFSTNTLLVTGLVIGAGAQKVLAVAVDRLSSKVGAQP